MEGLVVPSMLASPSRVQQQGCIEGSRLNGRLYANMQVIHHSNSAPTRPDFHGRLDIGCSTFAHRQMPQRAHLQPRPE